MCILHQMWIVVASYICIKYNVLRTRQTLFLWALSDFDHVNCRLIIFLGNRWNSEYPEKIKSSVTINFCRAYPARPLSGVMLRWMFSPFSITIVREAVGVGKKMELSILTHFYCSICYRKFKGNKRKYIVLYSILSMKQRETILRFFYFDGFPISRSML